MSQRFKYGLIVIHYIIESFIISSKFSVTAFKNLLLKIITGEEKIIHCKIRYRMS